MDSDQGRRLPRPYGGEAGKLAAAAYEPVGNGPDPLRTVDLARIGHYPLLRAWASLHDVHLSGREGIAILEQAIEDRSLQVDGPVMDEVAYFVGDLLCDERPEWHWNVDAWGLPVLICVEGSSPKAWDVFQFVRRRAGQESPSLLEALDHLAEEGRRARSLTPVTDEKPSKGP